MTLQRRGFTLIEILVAVALLGAILAGLLALTRSTLRFTGLSQAISVSVEDIADAEGYLSDMLRNAKAVFTTLNITGIDCDLNAAPRGRCLAVLTPVLGAGDDEPIVNLDLSVFAVVDDDALYRDRGLRQGANGLTLVEYRVANVCAATCTSVPVGFAAETWDVDLPTGVLLVGLSDTNSAGNAVEFFRVPPNEDFTVELTLVARANAAAGQPFVIREVPVSLQVAVRNQPVVP